MTNTFYSLISKNNGRYKPCLEKKLEKKGTLDLSSEEAEKRQKTDEKLMRLG